MEKETEKNKVKTDMRVYLDTFMHVYTMYWMATIHRIK